MKEWLSTNASDKIMLSRIRTPAPILTFGPILTLGPILIKI